VLDDDGKPKDLVEIKKLKADQILADQISAMSQLRGLRCRPIALAPISST
jgi:hypothetical protein